MLLVVQFLCTSLGKSGNDSPNAGFNPHVWPPSDFVSEHPHDSECICLVVQSPYDISIHPLYQCKSSLY